MAPKRPRSVSPATSTTAKQFRSSTIQDRNSTFVCIYSPYQDGVQFSPSSLQSLPEVRSASHRILAWRLPSRQRSLSSQRVHETGFQDDGERYGGKAILQVLEERGAVGTCLVARWYGGVMLGPVRFDHIKNCAKQAIDFSRTKRVKNEQKEDVVKRSKMTDRPNGGTSESANLDTSKQEKEVFERKRLLQELPERDANIIVLRQMLAELKGEDNTTSTQSTSPAAKPPDYVNSTLEDLHRIEKVRDATIRWILKGITKAEEAREVEQGWANMEAALAEEQIDTQSQISETVPEIEK